MKEVTSVGTIPGWKEKTSFVEARKQWNVQQKTKWPEQGLLSATLKPEETGKHIYKGVRGASFKPRVPHSPMFCFTSKNDWRDSVHIFVLERNKRREVFHQSMSVPRKGEMMV